MLPTIFLEATSEVEDELRNPNIIAQAFFQGAFTMIAGEGLTSYNNQSENKEEDDKVFEQQARDVASM